ncbi:MAG: Rieske (2Fe-2S) protein [Pseudomonadota bacterium]
MALASDLPAGGVLRAQTAGRDVAVWRAQDETVHCVDNRCPHRGMRLSFGFVRGNRLNCLYHGWQYGTNGICQYIPAHPELTPPPSLRVPTLPCCDSGGLVWINLASDDTPPTADAAGTPLRSLAVHAPRARVLRRLAAGDLPDTVHPRTGCTLLGSTPGATNTRLDLQPNSGDAVSLDVCAQPVTENRCCLHTQLTTAAPPATRVAVSRWLDAVRRSLEAES